MAEYRALINGVEIAGRVRIADTFIKRFKGLLFEDEIAHGEGLLISPCSQVHTIGMKFGIDIVFLSKSGVVLHTQPRMTPGAVSPHIRQCHQVLELRTGTIENKNINIGKRIAFDPICY